MGISQSERYIAALDKTFEDVDLSALRGKTILVTGATGMLGSCLIDVLLRNGQINVAGVGRDAAANEQRFAPSERYTFYQQDICDMPSDFPERVDYIVHAASNADPVRMAADPVNTLLANVLGTENLLRYGMEHGMKRFLYVSSGEVYGQPSASLEDFTEDYCGPLDLFSPRSCYPVGKRGAEVLCQSYIKQYQVDAVIVRPCHLFGPTMAPRDSRALSEFLWSAARGQNIVLKSAGTLERSHCYVLDAVRGLLMVLLKGGCGEAYNIADRRYQMRICDFAQRVAEAGGCQVVYHKPSQLEQAGYSKTERAVLDSSWLERLGWQPHTLCAIRETIDILREVWCSEGAK